MEGQHRNHGGDRRGMHCQERTDSEGGQEKDRFCFISELNSHFCFALCCLLFCRGVEFQSKYRTQFLVRFGEGGVNNRGPAKERVLVRRRRLKLSCDNGRKG